MSKNIPYTVETLAIEVNREANQIKLALDVFMELEMIELIENNIYRVKNFAKHQNMKVKEKIKTVYKEDDTNIKDVNIIKDRDTSLIGNKDSDNLDNTICNEERPLKEGEIVTRAWSF